MNYRAPSIARLLAIGCQHPDIVRAVWKCEKRHQLDGLLEGKMAEMIDDLCRPFYTQPSFVYLKMLLIDKLGGYSGVEYLTTPAGYSVIYLNAGDTYTPTLAHLQGSRDLTIDCFGDIVTRHRIR